MTISNFLYYIYIKEIFLRLFYSFLFFIIFFFIFLLYYKEVYIICTFPLYILKPLLFNGFISTNFIELFYINLYGSFIFSLLFSLPHLIINIWGFIKPALNNNEYWILFYNIIFILFIYLFSILYAIYILVPFSWYFFIYEDMNFIFIQPKIDIFLNYILIVIVFSIFLFESSIIYFYILYYNIISLKLLFYYFENLLIILLIVSFILKSIDFIILLLSLPPLLFLNEISLIFYLLIINYNKKINKDKKMFIRN